MVTIVRQEKRIFYHGTLIKTYDGSAEVINNKFNIPKKFFLKFFIYLTDVTRNNGCMSYIPESHKIGFEIRKAIYEKKINYQSYWS